MRIENPALISARTGVLLFAGLLAGCEFVDSSPPAANGPPVCAEIPQCKMGSGNPDPLHTCNTASDLYDCQILSLAETANEPDALIFKAQISLESSFQEFAVSPDMPCRQKAGWTELESRSFGLMQLTPACGWLQDAIFPDGHPNAGHPNLEQEKSSPDWTTSAFNPAVNIAEGVHALSQNREELTKRLPGCTEIEYTKMALGAYNQGGEAVTACGAMSASAMNYFNIILSRYADMARLSGWPNRYP